jgi:type IV pilus assembly protein PilP
LLAGCGGEVEKSNPLPPPPPKPVAAPAASAAGAPAAGAPATPAAALQPNAEQSKEALLAEVRKRQLANEDFVESDTNRDPFRSYLATFAVQVVVNKQHKILLEKFALDELKLIAIVGGDGTAPKAMFVDPGGMGVTITRGDHLSKSDATVTRIAPDRVFVQIEEDGGGGKPKMVERVLELHQGEAVAQ